jgi:hypothetical protein
MVFMCAELCTARGMSARKPQREGLLFSREEGGRESSVDLPFDHRVFSKLDESDRTSKEKNCDVIAGRTVMVEH